jgi:hypothetical protein
MSNQDQSKTPSPEGNFPRLVDSYKSHREALHSRVQELVNLRDQIRKAAAQEATDIVDTARRDVRQILVKARRELLVLAAQVQAATDERPRALDDGSVSETQRERVLAEASRAGLQLEGENLQAAKELLVSARQGVQKILESARPDLEALDTEMRVLRVNAGQPLHERPLQDDLDDHADDPHFRRDPDEEPAIDLSLSSGSPRPALLRRIAMPSLNRIALLPRAAVFVAAFGVVGILAMIGTTWWRSGSSAEEQTRPSTASANAPAAAAPGATAAAPSTTADIEAASAPVEAAAPVSVRLQAVRDVWLRTTIDGQADAGRLLRAGETRNVSASGDVAIRIGDGGALLVSSNGSSFEPAGPNGQVVTRVFSQPLGSIRPPASAAAPAAPAASTNATAAVVARNTPPPPPGVNEAPPVITIDPPAQRLPAPAAPPPSPAAAATPAPTPAAANAAGSRTATEAAEGELVPAAQRWFTQYHLGSAPPGGDAPNVSDDRGPGERPSLGTPVAQRTFDDVRVQLVGDNALYTARMTERVQAGAASSQYVSLVSQVWMRRAGAWRLVDVRLVSAGSLAPGTP